MGSQNKNGLEQRNDISKTSDDGKRGGSDDQEETEESDGHTIKKLQITKKRRLPSQQNSSRKRQHRRHFLLPTSSINTDGSVKSHLSNYKSTEYHHRGSTSRTSPNSSSTSITSIDMPAADKHATDERSRQSQIKVAVALGQGEWEIEEILGEKKTKGNNGERAQFLVRWTNTWVDGCDIDAPELFQKFRPARNGH